MSCKKKIIKVNKILVSIKKKRAKNQKKNFKMYSLINIPNYLHDNIIAQTLIQSNHYFYSTNKNIQKLFSGLDSNKTSKNIDSFENFPSFFPKKK